MNLGELVLMGDRKDPMYRHCGNIDLSPEMAKHWLQIATALARFGVFIIWVDRTSKFQGYSITLTCVSDRGVFEEVPEGMLIPSYDAEFQIRRTRTMRTETLDNYGTSNPTMPIQQIATYDQDICEVIRIRKTSASERLGSKVRMSVGPPPRPTGRQLYFE